MLLLAIRGSLRARGKSRDDALPKHDPLVLLFLFTARARTLAASSKLDRVSQLRQNLTNIARPPRKAQPGARRALRKGSWLYTASPVKRRLLLEVGSPSLHSLGSSSIRGEC